MVTFTVRRETRLRWGIERSVELVINGETVAGVWQLPDSASPSPAALLLHGLTSHKERMSDSVGRGLLKRGISSLALDLPMHGERATHGQRNAFDNPLKLVGAWRTATREVSAAADWLRQQGETDSARVGIVGYSLGGFLAIMAAADDPALQVVLLAAAGDLPDATPYAAMVRSLVDPLRAARKLEGRPLLLLNGRRDTTTRPAQAQRLFDAAQEPKSLVWYDGGHWPPAAAINEALDWFAERIAASTLRTKSKSKRAG